MEAQRIGAIPTTEPSMTDGVPCFVQAINELESHMTQVIDQREVLTSTTASYEELAGKLYGHAAVVKTSIIALGNIVESIGKAVTGPQCAHSKGLHLSANSQQLVDSVVDGLLSLYQLLYTDETRAQQQLRTWLKNNEPSSSAQGLGLARPDEQRG